MAAPGRRNDHPERPPACASGSLTAGRAGGYAAGVSQIRWPAVGVGFGVAVVLLFGLTRVGPELGLASGRVGVVATEFVALLVGGYVAGRLGGQAGPLQGVGVAIVYIIVAVTAEAFREASLAGGSGGDALPPLDLGELVVSDLVRLVGAWLGGWLADLGRGRRAGR